MDPSTPPTLHRTEVAAEEEAAGAWPPVGHAPSPPFGPAPSRPGPAPLRAVLLGPPGVGKSSLARAFRWPRPPAATPPPTPGEGPEPPRARWLQVDGAEAELELHDGDEEAAAQADALLLVFSLTDRASFAALGPAARGLRGGGGGAAPPAPPLLLVANKSDLARARHVTAREVRSLASVLRCPHVETSAELRLGTEELFAAAVREGRGHRRRCRDDADADPDDGCHSDGALRRRRSLTGRAKRFLAGLVPLSRQRSRSCSDLAGL